MSHASDAINLARDAMFVDTALEDYLTRLGGNYGVPRPKVAPTDDELYALLVQLLALQPKGIMRVIYQLMEMLFGKQADIIPRPWQIYVSKTNVITVEIPFPLVSSGNTSSSSYFHGLGGRDGYVVGSPTFDLLVTRAEDFTQAASFFPGLQLYIFPTTGPTITRSVANVVYNPTTKLNTITMSASVTPGVDFAGQTNDLRWLVHIPSDTVSHPGSYLVPDNTYTRDVVGGKPVVLFGPQRVDIFKQYMLELVKAAGVVLEVDLVAEGYVHPPANPYTTP